MVVDDSAVVRGLTRRFLEENPNIQVVTTASNGQNAVDAMGKFEIDVIVLDIEMPVMDGITAIPLILAEKPTVKIVMSSTLTEANATISLNALSAGASDYVAKPTSGSEIHGADDFKRELITKVLALGGTANPTMAAEQKQATPGRNAAPSFKVQPGQPISLHKQSSVPPRAIAIGSSTGGPQALHTVLVDLDKTLPHPIFITQHMPATFTQILADHLARDTGRIVHEAKDGQQVNAGEVYVAPGDYHMLIVGQGDDLSIKLTQTERENYCRPSVEPMLRSLIEIFESALLTVILTGMGHDGLGGCQACVDKGGTVIAQDEASSVVWGMPGAVATAGVCAAVKPLDNIAQAVNTAAKGGQL
ncbi:MAG: chemotaxis-specific protein-glutamate methyltransferase CheB [Alphaproteobacteria bacterium]|nr:chemotaxis-specific protein-glutamate methyltransferase CheB [Alphaproteobacteria bacterium]